MLSAVDTLHSDFRGLAPSQEHDASYPLCSHSVNDLLRELLPSFACVRIRLMCAHRQAGVEEQDATVRPWCQKAGVLGWGCERWVVSFEALVNVLQGGWSGRGWADGEAKAVCLVVVVVRVLTNDDGFDGWERRVTGPVGLLVGGDRLMRMVKLHTMSRHPPKGGRSWRHPRSLS